MCLTAIDNDDFAHLVYRNCTDGDSNQGFFMTKNDRLSGKIHILKDSNFCLQMAKPSPLTKNPSVFIHSDCTDIWEVLESGALKNLMKEKCLGRNSKSLRVVGVECESNDVEHWLAIDSQHNLFNLHFRTATSSLGQFKIDGYGTIPGQCHNENDSECDIQIYGMDTITIKALTNDAWKFTITGDIYFEAAARNPFPISLDTDEYDLQKIYSLQMFDSDECFDIHFKTLHPSINDTNKFEIDGYGYIRRECYYKKDSECNIQVCGRRTLVLRAYTIDEWQFEVSGDVGKLRDYRTAPGGTHNAKKATMDIDQYDYIQVYDLIPFSSCAYRAFTGGECEMNPTFTVGHCAPTCNLMSLVSIL